MANWQLSNKKEAYACYDKAIEWMNKNTDYNQTTKEEFLRFRAEATELLGIAELEPATDPAPQP
jgi:hypothetical protein